jgi:hypothetical protein
MGKIGRNDECPCGSGKKFKRCCSGKAFDWVVREDGSIVQRVPLSQDMNQVLDSQAASFRRHFERDPTDADPIFPEKYLYSEADQERLTLKALQDSGIDEDKIYAFKKTKRLILASRLKTVTGAAIAEWDEAIAEFHAHGGDPTRDTEDGEFDELLASIREEATPLIILCGFAADKYFNTDLLLQEDAQVSTAQLQFIALCVAKTHRTLRAIKQLVQEGMSDDALSLSRSAYENYLHATYVLNNSQGLVHLVDAVVGLKNGTHAYKQVRGKIDKRVIVEIATGKTLPGRVSAYSMAASSKLPSDLAFFDIFYSRSSEVLHPTVLRLHNYVSDKGLDAMTHQLDEEAVLYAILVGAMMMQVVKSVPNLPEDLRCDIETVTNRVREKVRQAVTILDAWQRRAGVENEEITIMRDRCADLSL